MTLAEINRLPLRRVRPAHVLRFPDPSRFPTQPIVFVLTDAIRAVLVAYGAPS